MTTENHAVPYPFIRCVAESGDGDGEDYRRIDFLSWRPGTSYRCISHFGDESEGYANAMGKMHLTVISTHKPGRYPERIFYTRQWEDPDGHRFGKPGLRITTIQNFKWLCKGYRHEYVVDPRELSGAVEKHLAEGRPTAPPPAPVKRELAELPF